MKLKPRPLRPLFAVLFMAVVTLCLLLSAPSLVVSGSKDTILLTKLGQTLAGKLPTARYIEVPDVAHLVPLEAPETANVLILDFLREVTSHNGNSP